MPITQSFETTPPTYAPAYNKIQCCIRETNGTDLAKDGYQFVIDINWDNGDTSGTERFYVPPHVDTLLSDKGFLDFSRFLDGQLKEKIVNPDLVSSVNSFFEGQPAFILEYTIDCYQGWDVGGVFTVDPDTEGAVSTGNLYAWDGVFDHHPWVDQMNAGSPFNTWICNVTNGTAGTFLSADPSRKVRLLDIGWTYYLTDTLADIDELHIRTYDSDGGLIGSFIAANPNPQTQMEEKLSRVSSAPASLNLIPGGQLTLGAQPIVTSAVASYTLQLKNTAGAAASEIITFTINEDCRYETYRIHFMNKLGGFDAYNFMSYSKETTKITRKQYTKDETIISDSGGIEWYNVDNGRTDYLVKYRDKVKLKSDYLTDDEVTWLKELATTPQAYLEYTDLSGTKNLKPVYITAKGYKNVINENDKLFQLEIDMELAHQNIRQRR